MNKAGLEEFVDQLRAMGEISRARIIALLQYGELSVGELVQILNQSQPRLSRHLKFLSAANIVERMPEGAWVFYRLKPHGPGRKLADTFLSIVDSEDPVLSRDKARLEQVHADRRATAQSFFESSAADWDAIRSLHYPESLLEAEILKAAGKGPFDLVVDLGTGTGRMLTLFADRARQLEGIDLSHQMLTMARANLAAANVTNAAVRHGDVVSAPLPNQVADLVIIHQVLHYLEDPARAIHEATRLLKPGGRLIVVDFAQHSLEQLRIEQSHRHLGFAEDYFSSWCQNGQLIPHPTLLLDAPEDKEAGLAVLIWTAEKADRVPPQINSQMETEK